MAKRRITSDESLPIQKSFQEKIIKHRKQEESSDEGHEFGK
jgi:hypothetical protein